MQLSHLGWTDYFAAHAAEFDASLAIGRVAIEHKKFLAILSEHGELTGEISGKLRHNAKSEEDFPAVGDWVVFRHLTDENKAIIQAILPRKSKISRKVAGDYAIEQVIAANVDNLLIVSSMNNEFNARRLERYLTLAWDAGSNPVIVLSKADLTEDPDFYINKAEEISFGVPVHAISSTNKNGLEALHQYFANHKTCALLGSSGVGKSTLINALIGEERQKVAEIREGDHKGRHTTTQRELIILPNGGLIIDTPGMREIQLWEASDGVAEAFEEISEAAANCRFRDCTHTNEPGCAVLEAVREGDIPPDRYQNFLKMQSELKVLNQRQEIRARIESKRQGKIMERSIRNMYKIKGKE